MCSRVRCGTCNKFTWSGCGEHVEEALYGVPENQICSCSFSNESSKGGFFSRLFGAN